MQEALAQATSSRHTVVASLHVASANAAAVALYQSLGFTTEALLEDCAGGACEEDDTEVDGFSSTESAL